MMSSSRQTSGDKSKVPIAAANAAAVASTSSPAPAQPGGEPVARRRRGRPPGSGSGDKSKVPIAAANAAAVASTTSPAPAQPGGEPVARRRRGRPPGSGSGDKSKVPIAAANAAAVASISSPAPAQPGGEPVARRRRGSPPGSGSGSVPDMFSFQLLTVNTGENVFSKIQSTQKGKKVVCIVSAIGFISKVRFQRSAGTEDIEGQFHILCLSGSVMPRNVAGAGGISISLIADDGRVFGGAVAGLLTAASVVHVTLGSFNLTAKTMVKSSSAPVIKNLPRGGRGGGGASSSRSQGSGRPVHGQLGLRKP